LYDLSTSCSEASPYAVSTGVKPEQLDKATNDAKPMCDTLLRLYDAGTVGGQDSKALYTEIKGLMAQTPYNKEVASLLGPKIKQLKDAGLEGTNKGTRLMQENLSLLSDPDASKASQGA
jgi:hypothetical protein